MRFSKAGFTLIELMVVVAIVGILTAVIYPMYTERLARGRQANARVFLEAIRLAEENYRAKNGTYFKPENGEVQDTLPGFDSSIYYGVEPVFRYRLKILEANANWFRASAECDPSNGCNIDNDPAKDTWEINSLGTVTCTKNDTTEDE